MSSHIIVYITCESEVQALSIGHILVEQGIAACVNVLPEISSIYKNGGEIAEAKEYPLIAKTRKELFGKLEELVKELHSYENPCIIALPVEQGSAAFLKWINENTSVAQ